MMWPLPRGVGAHIASDELVAADSRDSGSGLPSTRPGCLIGFAAFALGVLIVVAAATLLMRRSAGSVDLGNVSLYAPGSVTYRSTDGVLVVRRSDGGVVAFSDVDPHNPPGRPVCLVTFRADLGGGSGGPPQGRFFDRCTGSMYDLDGHGLTGDGLNLQSVRVQEEDKGRLLAFPRG